jgi:hypothetical protein
MVLFSTKLENLVLMLKAKGTSQLSVDVIISNDPVELVDQFKYLGGVLSSNTKLDVEVVARQGRGLGPSPNLNAFGATST